MRILKKETGIGGDWVKVNEDIKDGDRIKILDAGTVDETGSFGPRKVFKILTTKKKEFIMSFNQTSLNNLVDGFGEDSEEWVNKVVNVFVVKQMVGDKLRNVAYLAPEGWTMDDDGQFGSPEEAPKSSKNQLNADDIPF